jgi:hypothetical protein
MRVHCRFLFVVLVIVGLVEAAFAQGPATNRDAIRTFDIPVKPSVESKADLTSGPRLGLPTGNANPPMALSQISFDGGNGAKDELVRLQKSVGDLKAQQTVVLAGAQQDDAGKKKLELLQKQIDTQQKMIELLMDHVRKQPIAGTPVEKLQTKVTELDARSKQAAQRDVELSQAIDTLAEQRDADRRNPIWPSTLKELFLPSQTNETPLSIYGTFTTGFTKLQRQHGNFESPEFAPFFLLQLNDRILLEVELGFSRDGVEVSQAQADFVVNDWLTVVAGRFLAPVGFFNERLHPSWINKLPDFPLMFRQVSPAADLSLNGVQLRGGVYLGRCPIKLEYSVFFANGLRLAGDMPGLTDLANLGALKDTANQLNNTYSYGGRAGFWQPELGLTGGVSAMVNGPYTSAVVPIPDGATTIANDRFQLLQVDAGYHKGNWDVRFEYAQMWQDARSIIGERIERRGLYAQIAYRPYHAVAKILYNTELVFRYGYANFQGIDPTGLDLMAFESRVDVPVNRHQYTFGINYYFYPSMVLRLAYEINQERSDFRLNDNVFMAQLAWGF